MNDEQFEEEMCALEDCGHDDFVEALRARDTAQRKEIAELRAALATQPAVPSQDAVTIALARRLLRIAYVWNDHNFDYAHREARREAEKHGITNLDEANAWLAAQPAVRGDSHE